MGDKISQLTSATSLDGTELVPVVQSGTTKKATSQLFKTTNAADLTSGTISNARLPVGNQTQVGALQIGTIAGTACDGADARLSNSRTPTGAAGGDLTGTYPNPSLANTGVTAGAYGSGTFVPQITVDAKGRITNAGTAQIPLPVATNTTPSNLGVAYPGNSSEYARADHIHQTPTTIIAGDATGSGAGTVNVTLAASGVAQGTYGSATQIPVITTDSKGRITGASTVTLQSNAGGTVTSIDGDGGMTGLYFDGGPITQSGTLTLDGTLAISHGGTGQTTRQAALNALVGSVATGQFLAGNGTDVALRAITTSDIAGYTTSAVTSVAGRTGAVTLTTADIAGYAGGVTSVAGKTGAVSLTTSDIAGYSAGGVTSVAGKTGAVSLTTSDITGYSAGGVTSVAGKTGAVTLTTSDISGLSTSLDSKAPIASPTFTGIVNTPAATTSSAGLIVSPGVAPLSPTNGMLWVTSGGAFVRAAGSTIQLGQSGNIDGGTASTPGGIVQARRDTAANWTSANPVLPAGTTGFEIDTGRFKIGDGTSAWSALSYFATSLTYVDYLIAAGGGGGGSGGSSNGNGAGGGAGGLLYGSMWVSYGNSYSIVIGAGGTAGGSNGSNSTALGLTAIGGGLGGGPYTVPGSGGSGGGGPTQNTSTSGGSGTAGQGYAGGIGSLPTGGGTYAVAGGGGGATSVGLSSAGGGIGGNGYSVSWSGSSVTYSKGGSGNGGTTMGNGEANSGNGGRGQQDGGPFIPLTAGGSGVVVLRYVGPQKFTGGTVTSSGGYTIHTFTTSGTFTA